MKLTRTCPWLVFFLSLAVGSKAQVAVRSASVTDFTAAWSALQKPAADPGKAASVNNLVLVRDRLRVLLDNGTLQFLQPVNGVVFGAVFHGRGRLQVQAPGPLEAQQLAFFTRQDGLNLEFSDAVLSFTDNTYEEIAAKAQWSTSGPTSDDLYATRQQQREDLGANLQARVYRGVFSANRQRTAVFIVEAKTKDAGWVLGRFDAAEPEEVSVGRWVDWAGGKRFDTWMSFPAAGRSAAEAYQNPRENMDLAIGSYNLDATVTAGAELSAAARVNFETKLSGEKILLFALDSNLRVDKVTDAAGQALAYIQAREAKDRGQSYGDYVVVVLPAPPQAGVQQTLEFHYAGKRAVRKVGNGNYFCESFGWYPTLLESPLNDREFASRKDFEMTFRSPKKFTLVATGRKVSESTDGNWAVSKWTSEKPMDVAGFAFGDYKVVSEKAGNVSVDIYANREPGDVLASIQMENDRGMDSAPLGTLSPAAMAKAMGIEMANTVKVFELFYGPYPYSSLAVTNIPYSYGQGWPRLIYLSMLSFLDSTQRNALGIHNQVELSDFFRAHESSHQWWGHRVGWKSYHDQWLSEGFAEFSGNLYVQVRESPKEYFNRLREAVSDLKTKDQNGHVYDSVGPIWMGQRLSSSESPRAYSLLVYEKGGYVLHMLRALLMDTRGQNPDAAFQSMMHDFTQTYDTQAASTEDFKAIVEKHMTLPMDLEKNHKMDWFFRQYVYGTGIPQYEFHYNVQDAGSGQFTVKVTLTRTGVPDTWMDAVPVYAHRGDALTRLGFINSRQPTTQVEFTLPGRPEKLTINDRMDILADIKQ